MRALRGERTLDPTHEIADDARMMRMAIACGLVLAVAACGSDGTGATDGGGSNNNDGGGGSADAFVPDPGYTKLISRTWTMPAGQPDTYRCVRLTLTEDTYITNIMAQAPLGTHHTVLSIAGANGTMGADGEYDCSVGALGMVMLYASGVGTSPLDFPTDVGIKIPAGSQIHLNLHLFNASDDPIGGESGIWVKKQSTQPPILAEMVFAGAFVFSIPGNGMITKKEGGCTVPTTANSDFTLFALWPHMHQIATHSKFEVIRPNVSEPIVLHDADYSFNEQTYWKQNPEFHVLPGDQIKVTCSWVNPAGNPAIIFGDSSNKEMCFTGMYRYPAENAGLFSCTDTRGVGF
jgi:Copper type II ascorbate-dependent monooxygenase, C-terminal domain